MTRVDDRGVSELLGAMLLFGLLMAVLVLVQTNAVPSANQEIEFEHSQELQTDFQTLDSDVSVVAATGRDRTTIVDLGVSYPNRFLLFNPGPASGTLSTTDAGFTVENAESAGETGDFWNGSAREYDAVSLRYEPSYNYYTAPTTIYETGTVVNRFRRGATRQVDAGAFVSDTTIDLVALRGERSVAQVSPVSVRSTGLSTATRTVPVSDDGDPIVVRLETTLNATQWARLLDDERVATGGHVQAVQAGPGDSVEVVLEPGVTYDLKLASVGIGTDTSQPPARYLTVPTEAPSTQPGTATGVTVEVRDAFNGPKAGVDVSFAVTSGRLDQSTVRTDGEGRATVAVTPTATGPTTVTATAELNGEAGIQPEERVTVVVTATRGDDRTEVNPAGPGMVRLASASAIDCSEPAAGNSDRVPLTERDCRVAVTFDSLADTTKTVTQARVSFYDHEEFRLEGEGGNTPRPRPDRVTLGGTTASIGADYRNVSLATIPAQQARTYTFEFGVLGETANYNVVVGDFFVVSLRFADGTAATYFVGPSASGAADAPGGTPTQSMADRTTVSNPTLRGRTDVEFTLSRAGADPARVTAITFERAAGGITSADAPGSSDTVSSSDSGGTSATIEVGQRQALDAITVDDSTVVTVGRFEADGTKVDWTSWDVGGTLVFRVHYEDGTSDLVTVPLPDG